MVYVDADELKWMPYVKKWMVQFADRMKPELQQYIFDLFERYVEDGLRFVSKKCSQIINQVCRATYFFSYIRFVLLYKQSMFDSGLVARKAVFGGLRQSETQTSLLSYRD